MDCAAIILSILSGSLYYIFCCKCVDILVNDDVKSLILAYLKIYLVIFLYCLPSLYNSPSLKECFESYFAVRISKTCVSIYYINERILAFFLP